MQGLDNKPIKSGAGNEYIIDYNRIRENKKDG
jgi:hypothetical protein